MPNLSLSIVTLCYKFVYTLHDADQTVSLKYACMIHALTDKAKDNI